MQLAKEERQRLIESVVSRKRVGTQFQLLDALAAAGCAVTQAVSAPVHAVRVPLRDGDVQFIERASTRSC